jgi:hypothetical protein
MDPAPSQFARRATRLPNWLLATGFFSISAFTYYYILQRVGTNVNDELEAEASRQDAAERKASLK